MTECRRPIGVRPAAAPRSAGVRNTSASGASENSTPHTSAIASGEDEHRAGSMRAAPQPLEAVGPQREQQPQTPAGRPAARRPRRAPRAQALDEALPQEPAAARAERHPQRGLLACAPPRAPQQARDVDARDQQQDRHAAEQREQHRPDLAGRRRPAGRPSLNSRPAAPYSANSREICAATRSTSGAPAPAVTPGACGRRRAGSAARAAPP